MSTSLKIAIVTPVFPPYRGGIGNVAYNHARILVERGQDVTVFSPDYEHDHPLTPSLVKEGAQIEFVKPVLKYGNAAWMPSLGERLKDFDTVILHYPFFGGMKAVLQAKKKYGFKLMVYYHMDAVGIGLLARRSLGEVGKGLIFWYATRFFLPWLIKAADLVLASSEDYAQYSSLGKYWQSANKFQVLPIGVDINRFTFSDARRERMILFVGGLDKAHYFKGVEHLIRAVALLSLRPRSNGGSNPEIDSGIAAVASTLPRNDSVKLVIAGQGELMEKYKKLAQDLGVADKVQFVGGVADEELVKLYQRAAVTVLPSIDQSEAFGIVLVESLACGTPVIAGDLPGVRSVFENNVSGFTVPPRDSQALAERIQFILDNPDKAREMGRAGRKLVEERYDWEVIGNKLKNIIESRNTNKSIQNKNELMQAVKYVAAETSRLTKKIVGKTFPIKSLTIFSHSQTEFELLTGILANIGKTYNYNNGPRVELYEPIGAGDNHITHLRIRKPDPERPQVGCNDFETDYEAFKKEYLSEHTDNLHLIKRPEYEMIELYDPEFNVLAYIVST